MYRRNYVTAMVTFKEPIADLDKTFAQDAQAWGASSLCEWIDSYEGTRFTATADCSAVITSEYNMESVCEWLKRNTNIETINIF